MVFLESTSISLRLRSDKASGLYSNIYKRLSNSANEKSPTTITSGSTFSTLVIVVTLL